MDHIKDGYWDGSWDKFGELLSKMIFLFSSEVIIIQKAFSDQLSNQNRTLFCNANEIKTFVFITTNDVAH